MMTQTLVDLVELDVLQELMQFFQETVGIPLEMQDPRRERIVAAGALDLCCDFHRSVSASEKKCSENSRHLQERLAREESLWVCCPHGLRKAVFPIRLNGDLLGIFLVGPFLHRPPDLDRFRQQAETYGYDSEAYIAKVKTIAQVPRERVEFVLQSFLRVVNLLVRLGEECGRRKKAEKELLQAKSQLEVKVEERTIELQSALTDMSDLAVQMNALLHDVEQAAVTDSLTKTYNRRKFDEVATSEQELIRNGKLPFSVIMLDIDHFKQVNDRYGHSTGDQVLKQLCDLLRRLMRQGDCLIRWGGEEFLIVLPATELDDAGLLGERIRQSVAGGDFPEIGNLTVSLGVGQFRATDTIDDLLRRVDQALYRAKCAGRDCVFLAS